MSPKRNAGFLAAIPWYVYLGATAVISSAAWQSSKNEKAEKESNLEVSAAGRTLGNKCLSIFGCNEGDVSAWAEALGNQLNDYEQALDVCGQLRGIPYGDGDPAFDRLKQFRKEADSLVDGFPLEALKRGETPTLSFISDSEIVDVLANKADAVSAAKHSLLRICKRDAAPFSPTNPDQPPPEESRVGWLLPAAGATVVALGVFAAVTARRQRMGPRMTGVPLPMPTSRYRS